MTGLPPSRRYEEMTTRRWEVIVDPRLKEPPKSFKRRKRAPELVHGLTERVDLKDWEFAIIQAALSSYVRERRRLGDPGRVTYAKHLKAKLRRPFARLVARTKRKHREILASLKSSPLEAF